MREGKVRCSFCQKTEAVSYTHLDVYKRQTIEGVRILEQKGFRSAVFEALNGAAEKGKKM